MAVLGRLLFSPAERLDLPDFLSIESYVGGDFEYLMKSFVGTMPYILSGFDITQPTSLIGAPAGRLAVNIANSVAYCPGLPITETLNGTTAVTSTGAFFYGLGADTAYGQPLTPTTWSNGNINNVYLTLKMIPTSPDTRSFWDPSLNGGVGGEFTVNVNTENILSVSIATTTGQFPTTTVNSQNILICIPICIVDVDPTGHINGIEDARNLLFRLGTGATAGTAGTELDPTNTFPWPVLPNPAKARLEPDQILGTVDGQTGVDGLDPFHGGDKNIYTLKQWMDAVMTRIKEIAGSTYWYSTATTYPSPEPLPPANPVRGIPYQSIIGRVAELTDDMGDEQEDRSAFLRSDAPVIWDGNTLTFTEDLVLEIDNTKAGGGVTTHTISSSDSPISIPDGDCLYMTIHRTPAGSDESIAYGSGPGKYTITGINSLPAQQNANSTPTKDMFVLFRRRDIPSGSGVGYLFLPFHKQLITPGESTYIGATGSGGGNTGAPLSPATGFSEMIFDSFLSATGSVNSTVLSTTGYTTGTYDIVNQLYHLQCAVANVSVSGTGLGFNLGTQPSWLAVGDIVYITSGDNSGYWRRVAQVTPSLALDVAFPVNPIQPSAPCVVSQTVWTKNLVSIGDPSENNKISDLYPSTNIQLLHVDYDDSRSDNDPIADAKDVAAIMVSASNSGTAASTIPGASSTFTVPFARPQAPGQVSDYPLSANGSQLACFLVFFCNPALAATITSMNLLEYECSLIPSLPVYNGSFINSAFARSGGGGSPTTSVNTISLVSNGSYTEWKFNWNYVQNLHAGTTYGDIEVQVDGKVVPRYVSGLTTSGTYYIEIDTNTIRFSSDLSGLDVALQATRINGGTYNLLGIQAAGIYNAIVGTPQQIAQGIATHSTLQAAIAGCSDGQRILVLIATAETININKSLVIEGQGVYTIITGAVTVSADYCDVSKLRLAGNLIVTSNGCFIRGWQQDAPDINTITDSGIGNEISVVQFT